MCVIALVSLCIHSASGIANLNFFQLKCALTTIIIGQVGCTMSFDGTQYVNVTNFAFPTTDYTVEMWVKVKDMGSAYQFLFSYAAPSATADNTMNMFHSTTATLCGCILSLPFTKTTLT